MTRHLPMDCAEAAARLYELIDEELTDDLDEAVRQHLKDCAHCFAVYEFEQAFKKFVEVRAKRPNAPPDLEQRILKELELEERGSSA